ncbi:MAG: amidohydrolase family protein [Salinigranum sp.]
MIVDAHAHLDEVDAFGWEDTPEKLLRLMDGAGIDKAVVTTYADDPGPEDGVERLREYVDAHPDRFVGFPRIDPRYGDEAMEVFERAITEYGMRGLKLHPVSNLSNPFADFTVEFLDRAAELGVPVLFHSGDRIMCLPEQIGEAAARTDATIIMGHVGGFFNAREALAVAASHDNVVLETSAFPYPSVIQEAVDRFGAERVIYGSDQPAANPQVELEKIRVLDLTDEQRERILCENIADLLGLDVMGGSA